MSIRVLLSLSLLFFGLQIQILISALSTSDPPFNASESLLPKTDGSYHFLKDVIKEISLKRRWKLEDVRVTEWDAGTARFGHSRRYEFKARMGKSQLVLKFWDKESRWKKSGGNNFDFGTLISGISSSAVLDTFQIGGPFEVSVAGDDELLLRLPVNSTRSGLKRILVGEGITVEVRRAREVSFFHASDLGLPVNNTLAMNPKATELWPFWNSFCFPLLPIKISGSASLVAYRTQDPTARIRSTFLSNQTVELLPEKCYVGRTYKNRAWPLDSFSPRAAVAGKLLRSFIGDGIRQGTPSSSVRARVEASAVVRFEVKLERDVRRNDAFYVTMAEWRTRPTVERVVFEVLARIEDGRLTPMAFRKVAPFIESETVAWSSLMSNISFTKFPSVHAPQEALTLDVKW